MRQLIRQVREAIPFDLSEEKICGDTCQGCSSKLLIYLETELDAWEIKLADGIIPNFGDLDRLARQSKKIHHALEQNGLLAGREH
ncbi:MAG: hypothetical protein KZQ65_00555 [Candidatus Thiodiazotropha sp. (ex Gloverina cf. vestifex)]|nr:hypothetical protein [Candidatus Thiodiazotropha sp. (ex Gloverina cf. vestifex)]